MDAVETATLEFVNKQIAALQELIQKKDAMIISLQDRSSDNSQQFYVEQRAHQATKDAIKEYVIECLGNREFTYEVAEMFAQIGDFELTKTVTVNAVVEFEVQIEVPFDVDADDVANTLEFSVDSFDYSIDGFDVDTRSIQAEDNIAQGAMTMDLPHVLKLGKGPEQGHVNCSPIFPLIRVVVCQSKWVLIS